MRIEPLVTAERIDSQPVLRVAHLDHSVAEGGAEFGLLRILMAAHPWHGSVILPPDRQRRLGVFAPLARNDNVEVAVVGLQQPAGAARAGGLAAVVFGLRIATQAMAFRTSRSFRRAEVVHANTSRAAIIAAIACLGTRKALVVQIRDMVSPEGVGGLGFRLLSRFVLPRAAAIIGASRSALASAEPFAASGAITAVIPSAIGLTSVPTEGPTRPLVAAIGMVARLAPWKGQAVLLEAFTSAFPNSDERLVFAGGAPFGEDAFERELRARAEELGISHRVDFLGHVEDVPRLLAGLDICVQASIKPEPLGQNVLQYLAAGRPTIVSNEGGPTEWISDGENGMVFTPGSIDELASRLRLLATDVELRRRLARNAAASEGLISDVEVARLHGEIFRRSVEGRAE